MNGDPTALIALASSGVAALSVASAAALRGWTAWLDLKRLEMRSGPPSPGAPAPRGRAEVTELRERVRRLEAIANGADY